MDAATREYRRRQNAAKRKWTLAVLAAGATDAQLRALSVAVALLVAERIAAGGTVTAAWLARQPQFQQLAAAVAATVAARSQIAEQQLPDQLATVRNAAVAYVAARGLTGDVQDDGAVGVLTVAAVAYLLARRRQNARLRARLAAAVAAEAARPVKPFTPASVIEVVTGRVNAETAHTLTVLATETANAGRAVIVGALGDRGSWVWVTAGDERTCRPCAERNGHIYPADTPFTVFHPRCRCIPMPL